jgi:serine O-acetyltransferase
VLYGYIYNLRKTEYHFNTNHKLRFIFYKMRLHRMSNLYAIHIGINVCDEGLSIAHVGPVIINGKSHVGKNCRIHVSVNIGANGGEPPIIGNEVYIDSGAKFFGNIRVADGCRISANAVVCKNCEEENSTLVGVPVKIIGLHVR